jgi:hypothetical protein
MRERQVEEHYAQEIQLDDKELAKRDPGRTGQTLTQ